MSVSGLGFIMCIFKKSGPPLYREVRTQANDMVINSSVSLFDIAKTGLLLNVLGRLLQKFTAADDFFVHVRK